jgi:tRNA(adenine34) deaminase
MRLGENQVQEAMREAIHLASRAQEEGDVPVGAVVLDPEGVVIGRGWNTREALQSPLGHAEVMAIQEAAQNLGSWRLNHTTLVVTLEPCVMCAGAIVASRIERVVFGAYDRKAGAACSLYAIPQDPRLNHRVELEGGVLEEECSDQLQRFFQNIRSSD